MALLLEAGLLLILIPWSAFWDRNFFLEAVPALHGVMTNNFVRGAITGLGIVNVFAALGEMTDMFARGREDADGPDTPGA